MDADNQLLRTSERDWEWWSLFVKGYSAREIARHYDVKEGLVLRTITACRKSFRPQDLEDVRREHLEGLRTIAKMMWDIAERPGAPVTSGKDGMVVCDPDTGEVVRDYSGRISAAGMIIKAQERAAKLIGLDAPVKTSIAVEGENIDASLMDLARQLGLPAGGIEDAEVVDEVEDETVEDEAHDHAD